MKMTKFFTVLATMVVAWSVALTPAFAEGEVPDTAASGTADAAGGDAEAKDDEVKDEAAAPAEQRTQLLDGQSTTLAATAVTVVCGKAEECPAPPSVPSSLEAEVRAKPACPKGQFRAIIWDGKDFKIGSCQKFGDWRALRARRLELEARVNALEAENAELRKSQPGDLEALRSSNLRLIDENKRLSADIADLQVKLAQRPTSGESDLVKELRLRIEQLELELKARGISPPPQSKPDSSDEALSTTLLLTVSYEGGLVRTQNGHGTSLLLLGVGAEWGFSKSFGLRAVGLLGPFTWAGVDETLALGGEIEGLLRPGGNRWASVVFGARALYVKAPAAVPGGGGYLMPNLQIGGEFSPADWVAIGLRVTYLVSDPSGCELPNWGLQGRLSFKL